MEAQTGQWKSAESNKEADTIARADGDACSVQRHCAGKKPEPPSTFESFEEEIKQWETEFNAGVRN